MNKFCINNYRKPVEKEEQLSSVSRSVILSLLYFDVFNYPLIPKEIELHSNTLPISEAAINKVLDELINQKLIGSFQNYFFLPDRNSIVQRRIDGNKKAEEYLKKAQKISNFISCFPFVKGIFLSGSVAKGYADKDSDIDYFIVTTPNRLWLSRTILIMFKKIVLLNSKKYFCLNYFIDSEHLEILDKNIFTAVELCYLLPTYNKEIAERMVRENNWTKEYFPNFVQRPLPIIPENNLFIKRLLEKIFSGYIGNKLDDFCLSITEKFWKHKFRKMIDKNDTRIRCKKYVSKFHPRSFQSRVLDKYEGKISWYEQTYNISLRS